VITGSVGQTERSVYTMALNASYEIDFWGKNRANSRAAQENAISVRFTRDVVTLSTMASVATAYFQVVTSQERLKTARKNLAAAQRVLDLIGCSASTPAPPPNSMLPAGKPGRNGTRGDPAA
jgi:outer membrane protein TolC